VEAWRLVSLLLPDIEVSNLEKIQIYQIWAAKNV
jgi:hypothetical protein